MQPLTCGTKAMKDQPNRADFLSNDKGGSKEITISPSKKKTPTSGRNKSTHEKPAQNKGLPTKEERLEKQCAPSIFST